MSNFTLKSITAGIHDTGFGGYPFKVTVMVSMLGKDFNKLCPVIGHRGGGMFSPRRVNRDLGNLVLAVNNAVYAFNPAIPAHSPSIDSNGSKRASCGIKTLEFVYFFKDAERARALGFDFHQCGAPKAFQCFSVAGRETKAC